MLTFKVFAEYNNEEVKSSLFSLAGEGREEGITEIIDGMLEVSDGDTELAATYFSGCLLIRIFDMGRYIFPLPFELAEDADITAAIYEIAEYAMREEIGLTFTDVPPDMLSLFSRFRHLNIDAEEPIEDSTYRVSVKTECELLSEIPSMAEGDVSLTPLSEYDTQDYARLCKNEEIIRLWGYDYREDVPNAPDSYFIENALREFNTGTAITLAIRQNGVFAGEAVIYGFLGTGRAEIAVRILPEHRGKGLGSRALSLLIRLAKRIGLISLVACVYSENTHSVKMTGKYMTRDSEDGDRVKFTLEI